MLNDVQNVMNSTVNHPNLSSSQSRQNQSGIYGSLETLTRREQQDHPTVGGRVKRLNGTMVLLSFTAFTVAGIALFALVTVLVMKSVLVPEVSQSKVALDYPSINNRVLAGDEVTDEEFRSIKSKLHSFFTDASAGKTQKPIKLGEREVNAFLKHDRRLGKLVNTTSVKIRNNRVQTFFDIKMGDAKFMGNEPISVKGAGLFRVGMHGGQIQLAVDSLRVNHKNMHRWMHRIHNSSIRQMASNGLKRMAKIPMGWIGKDVKISTSTKAVKTFMTLSNDSTGDMFESISYQGNGILNVIVEPFQKHALNRLFKVHSRLHDLALSLDRVEVSDGFIVLYPRMAP
jgi:hypothetical protein